MLTKYIYLFLSPGFFWKVEGRAPQITVYSNNMTHNKKISPSKLTINPYRCQNLRTGFEKKPWGLCCVFLKIKTRVCTHTCTQTGREREEKRKGGREKESELDSSEEHSELGDIVI